MSHSTDIPRTNSASCENGNGHGDGHGSASPVRVAPTAASPSRKPLAVATDPDALCAKALPRYACYVINLLEEAGFEAWVVGGFVRDCILGRPCHDIDIATSARWQQVESLCVTHRLSTHPTGIKHGTITVVLPQFDMASVEVTTYRADGGYTDNRHPDTVSFVSTIEEDLARRDFTINALAYHPDFGILDRFGGLNDMQEGVIRIVGDPRKRFGEDALRILRACRFSSQLGFAIEKASYQAMLACKSMLRHVSSERVTHELDQLLQGEHVHDALMATADVLSYVVPELCAMKDCPQKTPYHIYDVLEHTAYVVQNTPCVRTLRWAALCHDMGKPAAAFYDEQGVEHFYGHEEISCRLTQGLIDRLLMSNAVKHDVLLLVRYHDTDIAPTSASVKRALTCFEGNAELLEQLCDLKTADALSQAPEYAAERLETAQQIREKLHEVIENNEALCVRDLAIGGNDVMEAGVPEGRQVGQILDKLLDDVIEARVPNEKKALLRRLSETLDS